MAQEKTLDELQGRAAQLDLPAMAVQGQSPADDAAFNAMTLRDELDLIPDDEFARAIGLEPQTLAAWRSSGQGPDYVKLGKSVFYRRADVKVWIETRVTPAAKAA